MFVQRLEDAMQKCCKDAGGDEKLAEEISAGFKTDTVGTVVRCLEFCRGKPAAAKAANGKKAK